MIAIQGRACGPTRAARERVPGKDNVRGVDDEDLDEADRALRPALAIRSLGRMQWTSLVDHRRRGVVSYLGYLPLNEHEHRDTRRLRRLRLCFTVVFGGTHH